MSLIPISASLEQARPPQEAALRISRSVSSGTLATMADAQNHLVGWRGRRAAHMQVGYSALLGAGSGPAFDDPNGKGFGTLYLPWVCSPRAEQAQVVLTYQASVVATNTNIKIALDAINFGGVNTIIDPISGAGWAYEHRTDEGTLDTGRRLAAFSGVATTSEYPVMTVSTGDLVVASPTVGVTAPRCLNIPAANRGSPLALVVRWQECRVISIDVQELWLGMVEQ
jgi:hypothetical protein